MVLRPIGSLEGLPELPMNNIVKLLCDEYFVALRRALDTLQDGHPERATNIQSLSTITAALRECGYQPIVFRKQFGVGVIRIDAYNKAMQALHPPTPISEPAEPEPVIEVTGTELAEAMRKEFEGE